MRVASRRFSPVTHRPIATQYVRALSTFLPPHPAFIDFRLLMERDNEKGTNKYPNNYMPITYKEWPNGMDEDLYDVVSFLKVLQRRYDAVGELISTKNADLIDENYHMLFPTLVKATWGMPEFAKLPLKDLTNLVDEELYASLVDFVTSADGVAKLEAQREKITDTINTVLTQTPVVLKEVEISQLLAMNEEERKEELIEQYGLDLDQRAKVAGLSPEDYIKSLGFSDEKTINEYLRELEYEIKMIRKWQLHVPTIEYEQQIRDHLASSEVVAAIESLKSGEGVKSEEHAFELLDTVMKGPKDIIQKAALEAIREVPTGEYMENAEKDFLRLTYADPEMSGKKEIDPFNTTRWHKATMTDDNRWAMLRFFTVIFAMCMTVQAASVIPGNMHYIKKYGHFIGHRSGYYN